MKRLRYLIEALALRAAFALLSWLPVDAASNLGGFLGRHIGPHLPVSARARRNLRLAFPEISAAELRDLRDRAHDLDAVLVTTEKDAVRLAPGQREGIETLAVAVAWDDPAALQALLDKLPHAMKPAP